MGQVLHGNATTTYAIRAAIQRSKAPLKDLAARYGLNQKTVAKWRKRAFVNDVRKPALDLSDIVREPCT
jgi:transposase-like protein